MPRLLHCQVRFQFANAQPQLAMEIKYDFSTKSSRPNKVFNEILDSISTLQLYRDVKDGYFDKFLNTNGVAHNCIDTEFIYLLDSIELHMNNNRYIANDILLNKVKERYIGTLYLKDNRSNELLGYIKDFRLSLRDEITLNNLKYATIDVFKGEYYIVTPQGEDVKLKLESAIDRQYDIIYCKSVDELASFFPKYIEQLSQRD